MTERRRTQHVTVLDHVAADSLVAHLEPAHVPQTVLRNRPYHLPHRQWCLIFALTIQLFFLLLLLLLLLLPLLLLFGAATTKWHQHAARNIRKIDKKNKLYIQILLFSTERLKTKIEQKRTWKYLFQVRKVGNVYSVRCAMNRCVLTCSASAPAVPCHRTET